EARLFAVKNPRRPAEPALFKTGYFCYCALGRQIAVQNDNVAGRVHRLFEWADDNLPLLVNTLHFLEVVGERPAGAGEAVAVQQPGLQKGLQGRWRPADLM